MTAASWYWAGPLAVFCSSSLWAFGSTRYSQLSKAYTPFAVNIARASVALPLFLLAAFVSAGSWGGGLSDFALISPFDAFLFFISMVGSYGLGDSLFLWSTLQLGVPGALAIGSCFPIWATLAGVLLRGDPVYGRQIAGMLLAVVGVVIVILGSRDPAQRSSSAQAIARRGWAKGVALALLTSACWAVNSFIVSHIGRSIPVFAGNTVRMVAALVVCVVCSRLLLPRSALLLPRNQWKGLLGLLVAESFIGSCLFFYGLGHSPLVIGVTFASLAPVIAVPIAWLTGSEKPSLLKTLGIVCVAVGIPFLVR